MQCLGHATNNGGKNFTDPTKETYNEQLQPNQHPQQHRRSHLHRHFLGNLPCWHTGSSPSCCHDHHHSASRITQIVRRFTMSRYNPTNFRSSITAALFAFIFSAVCLTGALAPAQTAANISIMA
jgi:hypothetical protein